MKGLTLIILYHLFKYCFEHKFDFNKQNFGLCFLTFCRKREGFSPSKGKKLDLFNFFVHGDLISISLSLGVVSFLLCEVKMNFVLISWNEEVGV